MREVAATSRQVRRAATVTAALVTLLAALASSGALGASAPQAQVSATLITRTGFTLTWRKLPNATGYAVYRDSRLLLRTPHTRVTLTNLHCGRGYTIAVRPFSSSRKAHFAATTRKVATNACRDTLAPTKPTGLKLAHRTATSLSLVWLPSKDNVKVVAYHVGIAASRKPASAAGRLGGFVGESRRTAYVFDGLDCATTYLAIVQSYDAAGNRSVPATLAATTGGCDAPEPGKDPAGSVPVPPTTPIAPTPPVDPGTGGTTPSPSPPAPPPPLDTAAPSVPTGLHTTAVAATSVSIAWTASTDNVSVTGYTTYSNGTSAGTSTSTSYTVSGLTCGSSYSFTTDAYDAAGNRSAVSSALSVVTSPCGFGADTLAPSVPTGLHTTTVSLTSVALAWTASTDNVGVTGYTAYADGAGAGSGAGTSFTVTGLTCGTTYAFTVDAYDAAGNHSTRSAAVNAATSTCPDTTAPAVPTGLHTTALTTTSVALAWSASTDNVAVTGYTTFRGVAIAGTGAAPGLTVTGLACGTSYAFAVDAYDASGNHSARTATLNASTSACGDATAPSVPAGLGASGATTTSVSLGWSASTDNVGVTGYTTYLNGASSGTGAATSYTVGGLLCGTSYAFAVDAYDASGNHSARSATVNASTGACGGGGGGGGIYYLATNGSDSSPCNQTAPCATMARALSLAQPGNTVQLLPGNYGNLTISRQSGGDSPKVVIQGDSGLASQQQCANGCPVGKVTVSGLTVCGHGLSIQNLDTNDPGEMADFYVGAASCPGGNQVNANYNLDLVNVHFNFGTLRCHDCSLQQSRIGPLTKICQQSSDFDGDNLHIWPDTSSTPWSVPANLTLDRNLIYDAVQSSSKCNAQGRDDHSDLVQTLGYSNLTVTNNIFWKCANSMWQDGLINGTTIGNGVFRNNFFASTNGCNGGSTQIGNADPGGACSNGGYLIENNTWLSDSSPGLYCTNTGANTWRNNYILEGARQSQTCGSGTWTYNVFAPGGVTCGTNTKTCTPSWLYGGAGSGSDFAHGWDLHISGSDTCLRGAGNPAGYSPTDLDGESRPQGAVDVGADEVP